MHQTIGKIAGKVTDYKICLSCDGINWYENEECISCENKRFRDMTGKDGFNLLRDHDKNGLDDETEIDV